LAAFDYFRDGCMMIYMELISRFFKSLALRLETVKSLVVFLWENKMWWLIPMILVLVLFFLLMIFAQSSPLGPFIYTLF
jgi:hypothetical protein